MMTAVNSDSKLSKYSLYLEEGNGFCLGESPKAVRTGLKAGKQHELGEAEPEKDGKVRGVKWGV